MKAILISIKPKWVSKILNGEKTIEIRKTMPKCDLPIDVYIYCTKGKYEMGKFNSDKKYHEIRDDCCYAGGWLRGLPDETVNGKVVAKFTLNKITHHAFSCSVYVPNDKIITEKACLTNSEVIEYMLRGKKDIGSGLECYAWHISNLVIFDKPRELSEFNHLCPRKDERCHLCKYWVYNKIGTCGRCENELTKAPQSFQFIEVEGDK